MPERHTDGRSVGRVELRKIGSAKDGDDSRWMTEG